MDEWYYALNQTNQGPVSMAALLQLLQTGQLPADNLVWRDGMADWMPANAEPTLRQAMNPRGVPYTSAPVLGYGLGDSIYAGGTAPPQFAGFWLRFAGAFIDGIVLAAVNATVGGIEGAFVGAALPAQKAIFVAQALAIVSAQLIGWIYYASFLSSSRQASLGMMAVGLRITDLHGNRISFARATGRHFASILSAMCLGIGYLMMLWSPTRQTLHDKLANTLVLTR